MISSLVPGPSQLNSGGTSQHTGEWTAQGMPTGGATNMTTTRSSRGMTSTGTPPDNSSLFVTGFSSPGVRMTSTCRGGIHNAEGPLGGSTNGILASLQLPGAGAANLPSLQLSSQDKCHRTFDEEQLELMSAEMSFSALYMHELHRRKMFQPLFDIVNDPESPDKTSDEMTQGSGPWSSHGSGLNITLPHIQEGEEGEDEHDVSEPLLNIKSSGTS